MTFDRRLHCIHTRENGLLDTTTVGDLDAMFERLRGEQRVVVHFHGGLIKEASGFRIAEGLAPVYSGAGAYPVFFVWSSSGQEVVGGNLSEIFGEDIFQRLLALVTKHTVKKVTRDAEGVHTPSTKSVQTELLRRDAREEPYAEVRPAGRVESLSPEERGELEQEVAADDELNAQLRTILDARLDEHVATTEREVVVRTRASAQSLMTPRVLDELARGEATGAQEGVVSAITLAKKAGEVLLKVVRRFRAGSDHGVYCTVVEELLRELYLANAGGSIWNAMKRETRDTFAESKEARGGRLFMDRLEALLATGARPQITLVGHSTGAVFIDNFLADLDRRRQDPGSQVPEDFRVRNVAFLAPANSFTHFASTVARWDDVAERFRMFTMTDDAERADALVARVYPRSLLYFVSGVVERDTHGKSAWTPIVGEHRYYAERWYEKFAEVEAVGRFVSADKAAHRTVWSPTAADAPAGFRSGATTHGGFDDDALVRESLRHFIEE